MTTHEPEERMGRLPKRLEDLPPEYRELVEQLPPELRQAAIAVFPDARRDAVVRHRRALEERRQRERAQRERLAVVDRALAGEHGAALRTAALAVLKETGGERTPTAVQRIVDAYRVVIRETRRGGR